MDFTCPTTPPDPARYPEDGPRGINPYTLIRPWESLILAILRERCHQDGIDEKDLENQFRAHINRGILLLYKQMRDLSDLARLIPEVSAQSPKEDQVRCPV